jgi:hypothetical protein
MKEKLISWFYKRYQKEIEEKLIEEYYGFIPETINEPAIDFMSSARVTLERFFSIQAYNIQKRAIQDSANSDKYNGMLIHIRSLLAAIQKGRIHKEEIVIAEKVVDPVDIVSDFTNNLKEYGKN